MHISEMTTENCKEVHLLMMDKCQYHERTWYRLAASAHTWEGLFLFAFISKNDMTSLATLRSKGDSYEVHRYASVARSADVGSDIGVEIRLLQVDDPRVAFMWRMSQSYRGLTLYPIILSGEVQQRVAQHIVSFLDEVMAPEHVFRQTGFHPKPLLAYQSSVGTRNADIQL